MARGERNSLSGIELLAGLDAATLEHNLRTMSDALPGARLRPHVKAHKCTALARRQSARGHQAFTCATVREMVKIRIPMGSIPGGSYIGVSVNGKFLEASMPPIDDAKENYAGHGLGWRPVNARPDDIRDFLRLKHQSFPSLVAT